MVFGFVEGVSGIPWLLGGDRNSGEVLHQCYIDMSIIVLLSAESVRLGYLLEGKSEVWLLKFWNGGDQGPSVL